MRILPAGYETAPRLLKREIEQLQDEGFRVPQALRDEIHALHDAYDANNSDRIEALHERLQGLPKDPAYPYIEPDDLEEIRKQRPAGPRVLDRSWCDAELPDRMHGAWTGRAVGCALGKPVEVLGMGGLPSRKLNGREAIAFYLKNRGDWPLADYFSGQEAADGIHLNCPASWRGNIAFMEPDDDIHYTLIGLKVLEDYGLDFKWYDVANTWNQSLPYSAICTAETQAILNYNIRTPRTSGLPMPFTTPQFTRRFNNPYREWIGAQIRADGWAYACAGRPELAAGLAWRDAHWTHTANGIYGAMFVAAMIAAAFVEHDPRRLIEIGLSEIPSPSRLAAAIREALDWVPSCPDPESFMQRVEARYADMSPVHTINNALVVVMALLYGDMQPDRTICLAVAAGLDTDCNGATVGSVVGAAAGRAGFTGRLAAPLNDTIKPQVFGFQQVTMAELAARSLAVAKSIDKQMDKHIKDTAI